jgi:hypothetical protein
MLLILAVAGGCASPVPGQVGGLSSKRITVTIQCAGAMDPHNFYYFLINRLGATGDPNARGPVPVLDRAYQYLGGSGNGFATGSLSGSTTTNGVTDYGLTDYVVYGNVAPTQIQVYHINGDPNNPTNAVANPQGRPVTATLPDLNNVDINAQTTLTFQIDLTQLITDTNDPTTKVKEANAIHYIQVNIVATNVVPTDQSTPTNKYVDSMGNTRSSAEQNSFLILDLTQNRMYTSQLSSGTLSAEQPGDVYPPGGQGTDPIDLIYWTITVANAG